MKKSISVVLAVTLLLTILIPSLAAFAVPTEYTVKFAAYTYSYYQAGFTNLPNTITGEITGEFWQFTVPTSPLPEYDYDGVKGTLLYYDVRYGGATEKSEGKVFPGDTVTVSAADATTVYLTPEIAREANYEVIWRFYGVDKTDLSMSGLKLTVYAYNTAEEPPYADMSRWTYDLKIEDADLKLDKEDGCVVATWKFTGCDSLTERVELEFTEPTISGYVLDETKSGIDQQDYNSELHSYYYKVIESVNITIDEPEEGNTPDFDATIKTVDSKSAKLAGVYWYKGEDENELEKTYKFELDNTYHCYLTLSANDVESSATDPFPFYVFTKDTKFFVNGEELKADNCHFYVRSEIAEGAYTLVDLSAIFELTDDPEEPENPEAPDGDGADTGDSTNILLWAVLGTASLTAAIPTTLYRKKLEYK